MSCRPKKVTFKELPKKDVFLLPCAIGKVQKKGREFWRPKLGLNLGRARLGRRSAFYVNHGWQRFGGGSFQAGTWG